MPRAATGIRVCSLLLASARCSVISCSSAAGHQHAAVRADLDGDGRRPRRGGVRRRSPDRRRRTRLADALSRAVHAVTRTRPATGAAHGRRQPVRSADQPLRSALALAASVSHRGPPVSAVTLTTPDLPTPKGNHTCAQLPGVLARPHHGRRAPPRIVAAVALGAAPAWAHVHVDADDAAPGSTAILTFQVPGESETGALTTQFSVTLPTWRRHAPRSMPGWTTRVDRDAAPGPSVP